MLKNKKAFKPNASKAVRRPAPAPAPSPSTTTTTAQPRPPTTNVADNPPQRLTEAQSLPSDPPAPTTSNAQPVVTPTQDHQPQTATATTTIPSSPARRAVSSTINATKSDALRNVPRDERVTTPDQPAPAVINARAHPLPTPPPTQDTTTVAPQPQERFEAQSSVPQTSVPQPVRATSAIPTRPVDSQPAVSTTPSASNTQVDDIDVSTVNVTARPTNIINAPASEPTPTAPKRKVTKAAAKKASAPKAKRAPRTKKAVPLSVENIIDSDDENLGVDQTAASTNLPQEDSTEPVGNPSTEDSSNAPGAAKPPSKKRLRVPKDLLAKKPRKKRKAITATEGNADEAVGDAISGSSAEGESAGKRRGRRRAETPDDAEFRVVDHSKTLMAELVNDMKIGKKFSKHDEIIKREMEVKAKAKLRKLHPELVDDEETVEAEPVADVAPEGGVQMRVVNGQIVMDERTLYHDRHAQPGMDNGIEVVEENEFTRKVNSGSLLKRTKNQRWDGVEVLKLYTGLRMFGTDFEMIAKMFHNRSRREIKLRFNKEERDDPAAITAALVGERTPTQLSLEQFQEMSGMELESTAAIEKEYADIEAANQAERDAVVRANAEATRRKNNQIQGIAEDEGGDNTGEAGAEASGATGVGASSSTGTGKASAAKSRSKASKKKNMHSAYGGGEEVEILGDA